MPTVACPKCGQKLAVAAEQRGKRLRCPGCNARISLPDPGERDDLAGIDQLFDKPANQPATPAAAPTAPRPAATRAASVR